MAIDPKAIRRAMMVAKNIAASVSNVPLQRADGGNVEANDQEQWPHPVPKENMLKTHHAQRYGTGLPNNIVPENMFDRDENPGISHGTGPYLYALEHIGDLPHRLSYIDDVGGGVGYGIEAALDKTARNYDLRPERLNESLQRNYNFQKRENLFHGSYDDFVKKFEDAADRYAHAYRMIPVHTQLQELGRDAAIALGERDFYTVRKNLNEIHRRLSGDNPEQEYWRPVKDLEASNSIAKNTARLERMRKASGGNVERLHRDTGGSDMPEDQDDDYLTVYHGTPHRFAPTERSELGEFDPTKIGTGAGNQSYGHGLYLSQNPDLAKTYRKNLGVSHGKWFDKTGKELAFSNLTRDQKLALRHLQLNGGDVQKAESDIKMWEDSTNQKDITSALHSLTKKDLSFEPATGALYTVGLRKKAADRMLDWHAPFSQQHPDVQKALQDAGIVGKDDWLVSGMRGDEIYRRAQRGAPLQLPLREIDDHKFAAKRLLEAGIPGIKYWDNTSWHDEGGAKHNFVVFPGAEHHLKIMKREKRGGFVTNDTKVPVLNPAKAIRRATMIAKGDGGSLGGLEFPEDESSFRLRTKLNRQAKVAAGKKDPGLPSNERIIIRAPKAKKGEQQLPNFVVGPLNFADWTKRVESILTPAEIEHSAKWYRNIKGNFLNYVNGDEAQANKLMRAWLVAQQNTSPATAFNNVLLQREQILRGMPEHLWKAGGMPNPTAAARSVLQDQPIRAGVGVKISDFVDSAEGKDVRSWHGNKQEGGSPFVIDVHSARDTGLVDPALLNHLRNLGYNEDDLAKTQIDFDASPSDAQYENRAQWGRDLTNYLNKKGWMGIKNWRPEEIQAVGWMGMTKLTRNAEEDSASGLGRNLRRISYELAPGEGSPWAEKYGHAFEGLPDEERYNITRKMADRALDIAHQYAGTLPMNIVHGTGAWMQYQNPAAVGQMLATQHGADIAANVIGHLLHQTEVWHNRAKPVTSSPKGFAVDFIESNSKNLADRGTLRDFWQKIMDTDKSGLIQGFQPITLPNGQVGIRALVDKGGTGTRDKLMKTLQEGGELDTMLKSLPFDIESQLSEAEITKARNNWKENRNGQTYLQRISDLLGSDPSASLRAHGSQLEKELQGHLDEAYARQGGSWRQSTPGAPEQTEVTPKPPQNFSSGGSIDHALRVAAKVRGYGRFS